MSSVAFSVVTGLSIVLGCKDQPHQPVEAPLKLSGSATSLTAKQRSTSEVPGSDGKLQLTIDDITDGQLITSLSGEDGAAILAPASMKTGDARPFTLGTQKYHLTLVSMNNELIGEDSAEFRISLPSNLTETKKIESLIEAVEQMEGATFIRNGTEHDTKEAAAHLRRKWKAAGDKVKTAEEFVEHLASKSSTTGKPYEIRLSDGKVVGAGPYLRKRLQDLEKSRPRD
jgi:hypothetical protein